MTYQSKRVTGDKHDTGGGVGGDGGEHLYQTCNLHEHDSVAVIALFV